MSILISILYGLGEMIRPKRFLLFFLLYFLFSLCVLIFSFPILVVLPSIMSLQYTAREMAIVMINITAMFVVLVIILLINILFTGSLIHGISKKKGINSALKYSQKLYFRMFAVCLIIYFLTISSLAIHEFGIFIIAAVDWLFMFALPSIIIKKDSFDLSIRRSFHLVRKNLIDSFAFWLFVSIIRFILLFIGLIFVALALSPLVLTAQEIVPTIPEFGTVPVRFIVQMINLVVKNYHIFIIASLIASFFVAISQVFLYSSRTYYFLKISKRKTRF